MKNLMNALLCIGAITAMATPGLAQNVTLGALSGVVKDAQGGVLPGAVVVAVHTPTGTNYEGVTEADGRFSLLNVRVGGPYEVSITMGGFRPAKITGINVTLGDASDLPVTLQLETLTETVTVTAEASSVFSPSRAGTAENVSLAAIENLPTISRSLTDFARTSPFFVQSTINANADSALSVAGRNTRYNNVQIDGAVNNDVFGLAESGTPGGPAGTQPVSIDAIQELQLVVSPVDVRQAGFSGGGMNAITKSGTNALKGSVFYYFRDQGLVGNGVDDRPIATFNDKQFGGTLGGPIRRNKAFFFTTLDWGRRDTPSGYSISGNSGVSFGRQAEAQRFLEHPAESLRLQPGWPRRVHPRDQQRQDSGEGRCQHRPEPADHPTQLRGRLQRRGHAERDDLQLPRQLLPVQQQDQHHGGAVQLDVRIDVQRVARHPAGDPRQADD